MHRIEAVPLVGAASFFAVVSEAAGDSKKSHFIHSCVQVISNFRFMSSQHKFD